jgi:hypothetical protein
MRLRRFPTASLFQILALDIQHDVSFLHIRARTAVSEFDHFVTDGISERSTSCLFTVVAAHKQMFVRHEDAPREKSSPESGAAIVSDSVVLEEQFRGDLKLARPVERIVRAGCCAEGV